MVRESPRETLTREWLQKSHEDLVSAERLATGPPLVSVVSFHSQQAAEKALKGYLAWHDQPFRKTHRLGELVDQCVEIDAGEVVAFVLERLPLEVHP